MNRYSIFSCIKKHRVIPKSNVEMIKIKKYGNVDDNFTGVCVHSNPLFNSNKINKIKKTKKIKKAKKTKKVAPIPIKVQDKSKNKNRFKNLTVNVNSKKIPIRSRNIPANIPIKNYGNTIENGIKINNIYIGSNSTLPKYGWYQPCYHCGIFTSKTILFLENNDYKKTNRFHFHICKDCNAHINQNVKQKWYNYIYQYYKLNGKNTIIW